MLRLPCYSADDGGAAGGDEAPGNAMPFGDHLVVHGAPAVACAIGEDVIV